MPNPRNSHSIRGTAVCTLSQSGYRQHWNGGGAPQATRLSPQKQGKNLMWTMKANLGSEKEEEMRNYRRDSKCIHSALCSVHSKKRPLLHKGLELQRCPFSKERKPPKGDQSFPFTFFQKQNRINKCALLKFNWKGKVCFFTASRADGVQRSP